MGKIGASTDSGIGFAVIYRGTLWPTKPVREDLWEHLSSEAIAARRLVLAAVMTATFMAAIESSIVATAMPTIVAQLGGFHLLSWAFAAYLLAQAVTIPIY